MTLDQAEQKLNEFKKVPDIIAYRELILTGDAAEGFPRAATEIQSHSGLLRVHDVPYSVSVSAQERLSMAARSGRQAWLRFDDLLTDPEDEPVVYLPMLHIGSAEPVVIEIPVGQFSPGGFREAAVTYRSAMERAVEGNARKRLAHAERLNKGSASGCGPADAL